MRALLSVVEDLTTQREEEGLLRSTLHHVVEALGTSGGATFLAEPDGGGLSPAVAVDRVAAEQQIVPMIRDVVVEPKCRRDRLVAHLLRNGHAIGLDLAVRMVGADADIESAGALDQDELGLSARAHDKVLRVARTIADMESSPTIQPIHINEAVNYRMLDRQMWT